MLRNHDVEVDRSDRGNPVYHFSLDVDAGCVREMLCERGVKSGPLEVDYAVRAVWDDLVDGFGDVLDGVCGDMPTVDDSWDMLDEIRTTHVVYDEEDFWLALETHPELWDPPSFRTEGYLSVKNPAVKEAVRGGAEGYPSFEISDEDGTMLVRWRDFYLANSVLASIVEERYEERFGERIRVPVLESDVSVPVRGDLLRGMRDELRVFLVDASNGRLRSDLAELDEAGLFDKGLLGEFVALLDAVLSVDGAEGMEFFLSGWHIQELEDGSNIPEHIKVMANLEIGVPQHASVDAGDPDIPF